MRERIEASQYIELLDDFIRGREELSDSQLRACLSLIDRVLPKLASQTIEHKHVEKHPRDMTLAELQSEWDKIRQPDQTLQ
jgi:hypothetical protein